MEDDKLPIRLNCGESLDDLMSRVASVIYEIDPNSILSNDHPLHGLRAVCNEKERPISDLAWRLLVLETCGQIGYDQLDIFFKPGDATTWEVKAEFIKYLPEKAPRT